VSIPCVFVDVCAIWFLTADKQDFWTSRRVFHPIIVEIFGERRRGDGFLRKRKAWRRDDADDEGYCSTTGL
jgi:hypothetical protein